MRRTCRLICVPPTPLLPLYSPERLMAKGLVTGMVSAILAAHFIPDPVSLFTAGSIAAAIPLTYLSRMDKKCDLAYLTFCAAESAALAPVLLALCPSQIALPIMTGFGFYAFCSATAGLFVYVPASTTAQNIPEGVFWLQALAVCICIAAAVSTVKHYNGYTVVKFVGPFVVVLVLWGPICGAPVAVMPEIILACQIMMAGAAWMNAELIREAVVFVAKFNKEEKERDDWWAGQTGVYKFN